MAGIVEHLGIDFRQFAEASSDLIVAFDADFRYIYANPPVERLLQIPRESLLGRVLWEVAPHVEGTIYAEQYRRAMRERIEVEFEAYYPPRNRWNRVRCVPENGGGLIIFARETTQEQQAKLTYEELLQMLRQSEERFRILSDSMPQIAWTAEADGTIDYYNRVWYDYSGLTPEQTRNQGWQTVIHADDFQKATTLWEEAIQTGATFQIEYRLRRKDGTYRWHLGRSVPVRGDGGTIRRWVGTATDIEVQKRSEERDRFLSDLTERTRFLLDPDSIVRETVRSVGAFLNLLRFYYNDVDEDTGTCTIKPEWCWGEPLASPAPTFTYAVWGKDIVAGLQTGHTVAIPDLATDPRTADQYATLYGRHGMRAVVRIPLLRGGRWLAVFSAQSATPRHWLPEELTLLETVAERMWVTLEGARLRRSEQEQAEKQARVAEALQRSLLVTPAPADFPGLEVHPYYEPASDEAQIGGDWFDAFRLDGGRVALCLGDVTGHGINAALFTADMKFSLRNYLRESDGDPVEALRRLNQHVLDGQRLDNKPASVFVCAAVAVLNPMTGAMALAAAGMEPPLLLRAASGTVEVITAAGGAILGVLPCWEGESIWEHLGTEDVLLLYTDGISESRRGKAVDFFGVEGTARTLRNALSLSTLPALGDAVVHAAREHAGGMFVDDVCLLLARRAREV